VIETAGYTLNVCECVRGCAWQVLMASRKGVIAMQSSAEKRKLEGVKMPAPAEAGGGRE